MDATYNDRTVKITLKVVSVPEVLLLTATLFRIDIHSVAILILFAINTAEQCPIVPFVRSLAETGLKINITPITINILRTVNKTFFLGVIP